MSGGSSSFRAKGGGGVRLSVNLDRHASEALQYLLRGTDNSIGQTIRDLLMAAAAREWEQDHGSKGQDDRVTGTGHEDPGTEPEKPGRY